MRILIIKTSSGSEWLLYILEWLTATEVRTYSWLGCRLSSGPISDRFVNRYVPIDNIEVPVIGAHMFVEGLPRFFSTTGWLRTSRITEIIEVQ